MIIFTHMKVAVHFYHKNPLSLKKWAFIYGNIKPDITALSRKKHHYDTTRLIFLESIKDAGNLNLSKRERSVALGVVCHFICDYFCMFHAKRPYNEANILSHIGYEIKLHLALSHKQHRLDIIMPESERQQALKPMALNHVNSPLSHIDFAIQSLLKSYHQEKESIHTDLKFSFDALGFVIEVLLKQKVDEGAYHKTCERSDYFSTAC